MKLIDIHSMILNSSEAVLLFQPVSELQVRSGKMFCHLALQGKPAPKREPEVSLTSSQSRLLSSLPLVKEGENNTDS